VKRLVRRPSKAGDIGVAQIGRRLAIFTTVTILALLAVLGVAVYLSAQTALLQPLRSAIIARANQEQHQLLNPGPGHVPQGPPPVRGNPGGGDDDRPGAEPVLDSVFCSDLTAKLKPLSTSLGGPDGPSGRRVPSVREARAAIRSRKARLSGLRFAGTQYLLYTKPIYRPHGGKLVAVVETTIPETQYADDLAAILRVLLIIGGLGVLAAFVVTGLFVRRALSPIEASLARQRNFVADAAHELRTPLAILRSAAEMLTREPAADRRQEMAQVALEESGHLTRLVTDLSLLARSDTGSLDFQLERVDVSALLATVVAEVEVLAEDAGVLIEPSVSQGLAANADMMRLRQVVLILLDNAIRHSPAGGVVKVTAEEVRKRLHIRVADSGLGIATQDLPRIFDRFYRADASRGSEGTGLGLSIAQSIVTGLGGDITAETQPGMGAAFTVTLRGL
jgi:signal transduction histidine kinase